MPRLHLQISIALLALVARPAWADFVVESPPLVTREAAEAAMGRAEGSLSLADRTGVTLRVIRRYVRAEGWRYFVAMEAIPDAERLPRVAGALAVEGQPAAAWSIDGVERAPVTVVAASPVPETTRVRKGDSPPSSAPPAAQAEGDRGKDRSAAATLKAASKAHGGLPGGRALLDASDGYAFVFTRTVPDPATGKAIVARHSYRRSGAAARLAVEIVEGSGSASVVGLDAQGRGWILTESGEVLSRDADRVTEILERFSPGTILNLALDLPTDIENGLAWRNLRSAGATGAPPMVVLRPELPAGISQPAGGLIEAAFDAQDHRLKEVAWLEGGAQVRWVFDAYRSSADGLVIPGQISVYKDGTLVEGVLIEGLELGAAGSDSDFAPPAK